MVLAVQMQPKHATNSGFDTWSGWNGSAAKRTILMVFRGSPRPPGLLLQLLQLHLFSVAKVFRAHVKFTRVC